MNYFDSNFERRRRSRRSRLCRIEELENREMLSVTPWSWANDYYVPATDAPALYGEQSEDKLAPTVNVLQPQGDLPASDDELIAAINSKYGLTLAETVNVVRVTNASLFRSDVTNAPAGSLIVVDDSITTLTLTGGELEINKNLTIVSFGGDLTIIADTFSRVFSIVSASHVTLAGLTITGGNGTFGGGFYVSSGAALTLMNSTIAQNTAIFGGGIYNDGGTVSLMKCTVAGNSAGFYGGIYNGISSTLTINSTIVAANTGTNPDIFITSGINPTIISGTNNLIGDSSTLPGTFHIGNLVDSDPMFVDSANGNYHLLPGSPALATGIGAYGEPTDQEWLNDFLAANPGLTADVATWSDDRITSLDLSNKDLIGTLDVSALTALEVLNCSSNQLSALDVSNCLVLNSLNCSSNELSALDVSALTALVVLNCSSNELSALEVSNCIDLYSLNCSSNELSVLDVSNCTALGWLTCSNNALSALDVSNCAALLSLECQDNRLDVLDMSNNTKLKSLSCDDNELSTLDVSNCEELLWLECSNNQLGILNIDGCTVLNELNCSSNQLESLDMSNCAALTRLECQNNQLETLNVDDCANLIDLLCSSNQLDVLNVSNNIKLKSLLCSGNQLDVLDVSHCAVLTRLECQNNQLETLVVPKSTALTILRCQNNLLSELDLTDTPFANFINATQADYGSNSYQYSYTSPSRTLIVDKTVTLRNIISLTGITPSTESPQVGTEISLTLAPAGATATFEWYRGGTLVSTADVYTPDVGDVGHTLRVVATGTDDYKGTAERTLTNAVLPATIPSVPTDLTNIGTTLTQAVLTWTASEGATSYTVERSLDGETGWDEIAAPANATYTDTLPVADTNYYYRVFAVNALGKSESPSEVIAFYNVHDWNKVDAIIKANELSTEQVATMFVWSQDDAKRLTTVYADGTFSQRETLSGILDLSGCTELTELHFDYNSVESLNVSGCEKLEYLRCGYNNLTALDLSTCAALDTLMCPYNELESLIVSGCENLRTLFCNDNQLKSLNVTTNTALTSLDCSSNELTGLDVSKNTVLTTLSCDSNKLTELDVKQNTALTHLDCSSNTLTGLDVSMNTSLTTLSCDSNELTELDVSMNTALTTLSCDSNELTFSSLTLPGHTLTHLCYSPQAAVPVALDSDNIVDLTAIGATGYTWYRNAEVPLTLGVHYMAAKGIFTFINLDDGDEIYCRMTNTDYPDLILETTREIFVLGDFDYNEGDWDKVDRQNLHDYAFWGIIGNEWRLVRIVVADTGLVGSLDLSGCTELTYLDCSNNQLETLDVSGCSSLVTLLCHSNQLEILKLTECEALGELDCSYNRLTELNLSGRETLVELGCAENQLTELNVSGCSTLVELDCAVNLLKTLDVSECENLQNLYCFDNQLTALMVAGCENLKVLLCGGNVLTYKTLPLPSDLVGVYYDYASVWDYDANNWKVVGQDHVEIGTETEGTFDLSLAGATQYTWYVNGKISDAFTETEPGSGIFTSIGLVREDIISCVMGNETFSALTLETTDLVIDISLMKPRVTSATKIAGTTSIALTWEGLEADKYEIQYSSNGTSWTVWGSTSNLETVIAHLAAGTDYEFRVRAVFYNGNTVAAVSEWSNVTDISKAKTDGSANHAATKPKKVTAGKKEEKTTISTVTLNVNPGNSDAVSYIVVGTYKVGKTTMLAEFSYTVDGNKLFIMGLNASTKYTFYVAAVNGAGHVSGDVAQDITEIAKDKGFVKASATTAKYVAQEIKKISSVKSALGLNSVTLALTANTKKYTIVDNFGYTVAGYKMGITFTSTEDGETKKVKVTYTAVIETGLDGMGSAVFTGVKPDGSMGKYNGAALDVAMGKTVIKGNDVPTFVFMSLPASGVKYSFAVQTVATNVYGDAVMSVIAKTSAATVKYGAIKGLKVANPNTSGARLEWKPPKFSDDVAHYGYEVTVLFGSTTIGPILLPNADISIDGDKVFITLNDLSDAGIDFTGAQPGKYTFQVRAAAGILAENLFTEIGTSKIAKTTIKIPDTTS